MEYRWKVEAVVKTAKDLRHKAEQRTYIPKDTIVKIIDIEENRGYRVTTLSHEIEIDAIASNDAFQELTDFEKELIIEYGVEYANELIKDKHVEIKTHQNLNYIDFHDLRLNAHCPECDSMYRWKSDYFMRNNEAPHKIRDSYGHYLICECEGRWIPTKRDLNINVKAKTYLRNYTEPSRGIADPLCVRARWVVHINEPKYTNGRRSWWGIYYLGEYLEDSQKLKADNKIEEVCILYNDFIRLKKNFGAIYALRVDKNRSRERYGGDGLGMSIYQIQMNSSPSFWSKYLALLISESALCITRNGNIWNEILESSDLRDKLKKRANALITYRNEILAHADSDAYKKIGVDDFLSRRYVPQNQQRIT